MTNFIKMPPIDREVKETKKTVFTHDVGVVKCIPMIYKSIEKPEYRHNVMFLWHDKQYGDVFRVWKNGSENDSLICFGTAGDEFK